MREPGGWAAIRAKEAFAAAAAVSENWVSSPGKKVARIGPVSPGPVSFGRPAGGVVFVVWCRHPQVATAKTARTRAPMPSAADLRREETSIGDQPGTIAVTLVKRHPSSVRPSPETGLKWNPNGRDGLPGDRYEEDGMPAVHGTTRWW